MSTAHAFIIAAAASLSLLLGCRDAPPADGEASTPAANAAALKSVIAALPEDVPPELMKALDTWPPSSETPSEAAELAVALDFAGQLAIARDENAGYEAFRLAGVAAEAAVADVPATGFPPERFANLFYNQARALARSGRKQDALAALDRSLEFGLTNWEAAASEPDLASLHSEAGFPKFIEAARAALAEQIRQEAKDTLTAGETFPFEFTYTSIDGEQHSLNDYQGKVVIVDFWGTWCPPCREEIPSFIELQDEYGDAGLQILGLNYRDTEEKVKAFAADLNINYPTGLGPEEARDMVSGFRGYPTTVFVGRDGRVRATVVGAHSKVFLEEIVTQLLSEESERGPEA